MWLSDFDCSRCVRSYAFPRVCWSPGGVPEGSVDPAHVSWQGRCRPHKYRWPQRASPSPQDIPLQDGSLTGLEPLGPQIGLAGLNLAFSLPEMFSQLSVWLTFSLPSWHDLKIIFYGIATLETSLALSYKLKYMLIIWPNNSTMGYLPKRSKTKT